METTMKGCGKMKSMKKIGMFAMTFVMAFGITVKAEAVPVLTLFDGTTTVTVTDGGVGDTNANAGAIAYSGSLGQWLISAAIGLGNPLIGTPTMPQTHLDSIDLSLNPPAGLPGPKTLTVTLTDTVAGPLSADGFNTTYGGSTQGTVRVRTYANGNQIMDSGNIVGNVFGIGFGGSGSLVGLTGMSPITLTTVLNILHPGVSPFGAETTSMNIQTSPVPEPGTMLLLGSGLVGVAFYSRRKKA
jgi:hypothetical protein